MRLVQGLSDAVARVGAEWFAIKRGIEEAVAFSPEALHPIAGVAIQLAVAAGLRSSVGRALPWLVVLALELANEATDLWVEAWPDRAQQIAGGINDVLLTMVLPTLLLAAARFCPSILRK